MWSTIITVLTYAVQWVCFEKMGRKGWEAIIPLYNLYVLFEVLYGNGWKALLLLIPLYNIYLIFKVCIDLAHGFNQSTGFGIGLVLLPLIFFCILAFGPAKYGDGSAQSDDTVGTVVKKVRDAVPCKDPNAVDKLAELSRLHENGILSDEEFEMKKEDLMNRI